MANFFPGIWSPDSSWFVEYTCRQCGKTCRREMQGSEMVHDSRQPDFAVPEGLFCLSCGGDTIRLNEVDLLRMQGDEIPEMSRERFASIWPRFFPGVIIAETWRDTTVNLKTREEAYRYISRLQPMARKYVLYTLMQEIGKAEYRRWV